MSRELPELHDAVLDPSTLTELFNDLAECTQVIEVMIRGVGGLRAQSAGRSLDDARQALLSGQARGVQIRYRWAGEEWWDTLMVLPQGIRIVRIKQNFGEVEG